MVLVCLVSSVISWMPKPAAAHARLAARDLPMCVLAALIVGKALVNVPRCSQQTQTYRVVCVIRRVKASTTERPVSGPHVRATAYNEVPL